jgi:GNAT superfamily N-acetyltransferase
VRADDRPNLTRGGRPYGWVENVVTHPDWRRMGIGKRLLHAALSAAWGARCYKVMLLTSREQTHAFYESAGFTHRAKAAFVALPPSA